MTLYEIDAKIVEAYEKAIDPETGEIVNEEAFAQLDELQMAKDAKFEGVALWTKDLNAEAEALENEIEVLQKRLKSNRRQIESLKNYLAYGLNGQKFKTPKCSISYRKTTSVNVTLDADQLPDAYRRATYTANKTAIKEALQNGTALDFATLETKQSLVIK